MSNEKQDIKNNDGFMGYAMLGVTAVGATARIYAGAAVPIQIKFLVLFVCGVFGVKTLFAEENINTNNMKNILSPDETPFGGEVRLGSPRCANMRYGHQMLTPEMVMSAYSNNITSYKKLPLYQEPGGSIIFKK